MSYLPITHRPIIIAAPQPAASAVIAVSVSQIEAVGLPQIIPSRASTHRGAAVVSMEDKMNALEELTPATIAIMPPVLIGDDAYDAADFDSGCGCGAFVDCRCGFAENNTYYSDADVVENRQRVAEELSR